MNPLVKWKAALIPSLIATLLLAGCATTRIAQINADPSQYRNRTVRVTGTVTTSVGVLGTGGYQIEDESGKILVVSRSGVPAKGSRIEVTGTVIPGVQVLDRTVGVSIREKSHRLK